MTLRAYVFPKLRTMKDVVKDMSKNPGLRTTSTVNMLKDPKYLCNLALLSYFFSTLGKIEL